MSNSVTLWTVTHQAPLSMGFSRQEHWNGLPCRPPRDLPDPGIEPMSLRPPTLTGGFFITSTTWAFQVAQWIKKSPAMQETQKMRVGYLGEEDPLEEGMESHSSILAWRIPWTEEPGGLQSIGSQRVRQD